VGLGCIAGPLPAPRVEASGSPRFLGSLRAHALLSDPGGSTGQAFRPVDVAFRLSNGVGCPPVPARGSHDMLISGLNHTAYALAVYASQLRVSPAPRKTRFRLAATLRRAGLSRKAPDRGFGLCYSLMTSPSAKLPWRTGNPG
jgi:hypothetical protein